MRYGNVDDRVLLRRQDAADLVLPYGPGPRTPEVVAPHEPTFEQVLSQLVDICIAELGCSGVFDVHERAVEKVIVAAGADDEVFGTAFTICADGGLRELCETDAEVDVGARVVSTPPLAALFS